MDFGDLSFTAKSTVKFDACKW